MLNWIVSYWDFGSCKAVYSVQHRLSGEVLTKVWLSLAALSQFPSVKEGSRRTPADERMVSSPEVLEAGEEEVVQYSLASPDWFE